MKRSRSIRLVLLGSAGFIGLAGCDQNDPVASSDFFRDEKECAAKYDSEACRQALADARAQHLKTAPAFANREECEAQFGVDNCVGATSQAEQSRASSSSSSRTSASPSSSSPPASATASADASQASHGGGWFMPAMLGYLAGRSMGGGSGLTAQPLYRDLNNTAYSGRDTVGRISESRMSPPRAPSGGRVASAGVARGGFGSSASGSASS
ncbi:MAG: DUF1190 domain-containing protein [Proteobacteria bacterium]|nr:DUF1190 domain-containing protein [Pseudomonadota bacterium]